MVPKLRFKEFCGKWEEKTIGDILKIKHGKDQKGIEVENGKYPILGTGGVIGRTNTPICTWSCVLIGRKGTIDKPQYMDIPFWTVDTLFYSKSEKNNDPKYEFYLFQTINWMKYNEASGVPSLSAKTIQSIKVKVPSLPEQTKIADFLSTVDDKIQNQQDKITHLENIKKGFMQKIFSRKIRFKDDGGDEFPEWEEKKLGDVIDLVIDNRGKTPPISKVGYPLIEINAVGNYKIKYELIEKYVDEEIFQTWFRKYLKRGDILFSTVGNTALCSYYDEKEKCCIAQNIVGLRFNSLCNSRFMFYLLTETKNNRYIKSIQMQAIQPSIKVTQFIKLYFYIPCLKEQQKIADFLSSFDEKISTERETLEHLKELKKGLLQQMFV